MFVGDNRVVGLYAESYNVKGLYVEERKIQAMNSLANKNKMTPESYEKFREERVARRRNRALLYKLSNPNNVQHDAPNALGQDHEEDHSDH